MHMASAAQGGSLLLPFQAGGQLGCVAARWAGVGTGKELPNSPTPNSNSSAAAASTTPQGVRLQVVWGGVIDRPQRVKSKPLGCLAHCQSPWVRAGPRALRASWGHGPSWRWWPSPSRPGSLPPKHGMVAGCTALLVAVRQVTLASTPPACPRYAAIKGYLLRLRA